MKEVEEVKSLGGKSVQLSEKNSQRLHQLFMEKQKIEQLFEHTILTILDASDVDYTDKTISVAEDFKSINIGDDKEGEVV